MIEPTRLRAPRQDGAVLAVPPLQDAAALIAANRSSLSGLKLDVLGRPLTDLRREAAAAVIDAAKKYLHLAGEPVPPVCNPSLFLAGHQPELFHPGVWVKNFLLYGLARRHGATPVNLVVDNDTLKSAAISLPAVPSADSDWPYLVKVAFDRWQGEVPYEERRVADEVLFADFPDRVAGWSRHWRFEPLLPEFWAEVRRQVPRTPLLGERLAAARRAFEHRWGCQNLEIPVSAVCVTQPFAWFAAHLILELPRLHTVYNAAVHEYRHVYGIRSRNHPVPDLLQEDDWLEVPLWAWRKAEERRSRLLTRRTPGGLELRAGSRPWPKLPLQPEKLVNALQELAMQGYRIRSRALTNTLFARLCVGDLFLHGIGGGKYDELTDAIIRQFYGIAPPGYLVFSATLWLPFAAYPSREENYRALARLVRDYHWNPQRYLPADTAADQKIQQLVTEKQKWIALVPNNATERRTRFKKLRHLTEQLRGYLNDRERELAANLARQKREIAANAVLQRRDYAFCLFPEQSLRPFCTQFADGATSPTLGADTKYIFG